MQQWAHDLAMQSVFARSVATVLELLFAMVLFFIVYLTAQWRRAPDVADPDHMRRWWRAIIVGTLIDLAVLAVGGLMGWFGVLYALELRAAGATSNKLWFNAMFPAILVVGWIVWINWRLVRSGFKDSGAE